MPSNINAVAIVAERAGVERGDLERARRDLQEAAAAPGPLEEAIAARLERVARQEGRSWSWDEAERVMNGREAGRGINDAEGRLIALGGLAEQRLRGIWRFSLRGLGGNVITNALVGARREAIGAAWAEIGEMVAAWINGNQRIVGVLVAAEPARG